MIISFSPIRMDISLSVSVTGDTLTIGGQGFDFSELAEGEKLGFEALGSDWFAQPVTRTDGEIHVGLILPCGPFAPDSARHPAPIEVVEGVLDIFELAQAGAPDPV